MDKETARVRRDDPANAAILRPGSSFTVDLELRWGDMDALAHLNNVVYFRLMEEARVRMMEPPAGFSPAGHGVVLAHTECDFLKSYVYPDVVRVKNTLLSIGRSSMACEVVFSKGGTQASDEVHARGKTVVVWADVERGASAPWPEELLRAFATRMRVQ